MPRKPLTSYDPLRGLDGKRLPPPVPPIFLGSYGFRVPTQSPPETREVLRAVADLFPAEVTPALEMALEGPPYNDSLVIHPDFPGTRNTWVKYNPHDEIPVGQRLDWLGLGGYYPSHEFFAQSLTVDEFFQHYDNWINQHAQTTPDHL